MKVGSRPGRSHMAAARPVRAWLRLLLVALPACTFEVGPEGDSNPDTNYIPNCVPEPPATARPGPGTLHCEDAGPAPEGPSFGRTSIAYDSARDRVVLLAAGGDPVTDTWEFDGQAWQAVQTGESPEFRDGAAFVYHAARRKSVLFGGWSAGNFLMDTWEYDGGNWSQLSGAEGPAPTANALSVYDSRSEELLVALVGSPEEMWAFGVGGWRQVEVGGIPDRYSVAGAFDADRGDTLLYGGLPSGCDEHRNDTWRFAEGRWTELEPEHSPPPGGDWTAYYDEGRRSVIILRGGTPALSGAWEFTGTDWLSVTLDVPEPLGRLPPVVWDSTRARAIILDHGRTLACTWR